MKHDQFYKFVTEVSGENQVLAESIITAHKAVYSPESLTEGKLGKFARSAALAGALATGAFAGDKTEVPSPEETQKEGIEAVHEIQDEYLDEMDMATNDAYKEAIDRYNVLLELDPKVASHFARILNMHLHKKLGIAPPIGQQMGETQADQYKDAYSN